ncbi:uncharacterized protein LOC125868535 [Solanum stenotomum]|uniref:uncharacterized protein LOC125868535 n=1 Tax=Solanum stenotomum TaxID=172797 RepID=UPI0020D11FA3|nr:uncharacterized protein LOC125868535 [Solanum stenotomum]
MKGNDEAQAPEEEKGKSTLIPKLVQTLPKITPPFAQRLKKKNEDEKFKKFLSVFKTLSINLPLVEALLEMLGYAKFMKKLVTKKRILDFKTIEVSHSCSAIMTNEMIKNKEDTRAFTVPCTIGMLQFAKALYDLGESINLKPIAIYKQLGLSEPKSTTMRLLMEDRSIKHPLGILYDILIDTEIPIVLGRPFLEIGRALVDVESRQLKFWVNEDEVTFNVCKSMKHPRDIHLVLTIDVIDEEMASVSHLMCMSESLEDMLANYDEFKFQGYYEVVASLSGLGEYLKNPFKLDIDIKN